jgi:dTDP-6-deoxy-L-talose 4-dehydrogenase (NAD+)
MGRQIRGGGPASGDLLNIAVTGASGYVGRHVAAELARRGIPATLMSRARHDIASEHDDHFALAGKPGTLIHLAWGGLPNYRSHRHVDFELPAQLRFLEHMLARGVKNLVVTGTCLEYGMRSGQLREDMPAMPITSYAQAKDLLRRHLEARTADHGCAFTWARLFYSYGEGQSPNSLWPQLRAAVAAGERTFRMSGGEQQRDYLAAEEQARLLVALATSGRSNGVVNVCSGRPITVRALVEGWIREHGWTIGLDLGHYPYPDYEPMAFWGDRSKLDRLLSS